jgi:hypothetical protein
MALALSAPAPKANAADISINLRVGDPYRGPRLVFQSEPTVVLVPGSRVYYVRDYDYDVYRYGSYWYYNYDGGWYRARRYGGPYAYIGYQSVPHSVAYVPVKYRRHWRESPGQGRSYRQPVRSAYQQPARTTYRQGHNDNNGQDQGRKTRDKGRGHGNDNGNDNGHGHGHCPSGSRISGQYADDHETIQRGGADASGRTRPANGPVANTARGDSQQSHDCH